MTELETEHLLGTVFLHGGYHKTGTTFLQKQVFSKLNGVNYLGRSWKDESFNQFFKDFAFTNGVEFDATSENARFKKAVSVYLNANSLDLAKPILVSHESLMTGSEWFGSEVMARAKRIKATFPNSKVIIGIRNQSDFIDSNYRQYVILGGKLCFNDFLKGSLGSNYGLLPRLKYDEVLKLYFGLFGRENVHVYLLEELKPDSEKALGHLLKFIGVDQGFKPEMSNTNKGIGGFSIGLIRLMNKLLLDDFNEQYYRWVMQDVGTIEAVRWRIVRILKRIERNGSAGKFVTDSDKEWIRNHFSESNQKLSQVLNVDLTPFGY